MMNADKMLALIELYEQRLSHVPPQRGAIHLEPLPHVVWMLGEMRFLVKEQNAEAWDKVGRWLGFVQGVLWVRGIYSIDEMREQVKGAA